MPVKFKPIQKPQPGVAGGGTLKYYAAAVTTGERDIEALTKSIEKISTMSGADIRGVLYALVDVITTELAEGLIVRLGELGSFRISISSEGYETLEEVTAAGITKSRLLFRPGGKLNDMLRTLEYKKIES